MLFFWLSLFFSMFFFDENVNYFITTTLSNYIYSFDCFYFRYWEISHDQEFIEMFLNSNEHETYFEPIKSEEEAIEILKNEIRHILPENVNIDNLTTEEMMQYFRNHLVQMANSLNKK